MQPLLPARLITISLVAQLCSIYIGHGSVVAADSWGQSAVY